MSNVAVIVCAAGAGTRFGGREKKPFVEVAGKRVFLRSIDFFARREDVKQIILAISPEDDEMVQFKWEHNLSFDGVKICHGGAERHDTLANALELIGDDIDLIAVHDSVRCCLQDKWLDEVFEKAAETGAAILACPVVATLKKADGDVITSTVDRTDLYEAQTPQVFKTDLLKKAYQSLKDMTPEKRASISDDSMLVEALGQKVSIVKTDHSNIKITRKNDVAIAEAVLRSRPKPKPDGPMGPYAEAQW